jgi:chorismate synthase
MAGSSIGVIFQLHTFGESHGIAVGGIIDGCPPNFKIDFDKLQSQVNRRRPGQSTIVSPRNESDKVEILSGVIDNVTTGAPIAFLVKNENQKSSDYNELKDVFRPSHADFTYQAKYGIRDYRGGGRSSARETVSRVIAGGIAAQILELENITIRAFVSQIGPIKLHPILKQPSLEEVDANLVRCPDAQIAAQMVEYIELLRDQGDTTGGEIQVIVEGVPAGLGEPVFDKLHADLGKAMLSINAVKGFEIGSGFSAVAMKGSEHNDAFYSDADGKVRTKSNHSGGIQGGISNGEQITFKIAFKPVASIKSAQQTINTDGESVDLSVKGRHDPCVVPRAVPIVEGMTSLVLLDHLLRAKAINPKFLG